jgi:hypothetical protein
MAQVESIMDYLNNFGLAAEEARAKITSDHFQHLFELVSTRRSLHHHVSQRSGSVR